MPAAVHDRDIDRSTAAKVPRRLVLGALVGIALAMRVVTRDYHTSDLVVFADWHDQLRDGGIDALVFTAGIGENSAEIRQRICAGSSWLGIELDAAANAKKGPRISTPASRVSAWMIPTNEELMIARHTGAILGRTAGHGAAARS